MKYRLTDEEIKSIEQCHSADPQVCELIKEMTLQGKIDEVEHGIPSYRPLGPGMEMSLAEERRKLAKEIGLEIAEE